MMHDSIGMVDTGKVSRKTGESIKIPKPLLDYNKGRGGAVRQNGAAACIIPSHTLLSEGI